MATIQICPPQPAHILLPPEPQFADHVKPPVSIEFGRDGEIRTSGFDFGDYSRAHTASHKSAGGRRQRAPEWAMSAKGMAEVIARHMERRAGFRNPTPGNPLDRLQRAQQCLLAAIPRQMDTMTRLCRQFAALKTGPQSAPIRERMQALEVEIENLDSQIRLTKEFPAKAAHCIYLFFRVGYDSVAIGHELGMKPPHVRKTIWGLCRTARQIEKEKAEGIGPRLATAQAEMRERWALPRPGVCEECGKEFKQGRYGRNRRTCSDECRAKRSREYQRGWYARQKPANICKICKLEFKGRTRAEYCPSCRPAHRDVLAAHRVEKQRQAKQNWQRSSVGTREENTVIAVRLWRQNVPLTDIAVALGFPRGHGCNYTRGLLIKAGVRQYTAARVSARAD